MFASSTLTQRRGWKVSSPPPAVLALAIQLHAWFPRFCFHKRDNENLRKLNKKVDTTTMWCTTDLVQFISGICSLYLSTHK